MPRSAGSLAIGVFKKLQFLYTLSNDINDICVDDFFEMHEKFVVHRYTS